MVVVDVGGREFYLDGYLKKNFDYVKDRVLNAANMMILTVDGRVGSGKSTLASQLAFYCTDGRITLNEVTFTFDQFSDALNNLPKGGAVILDEAFSSMNKRTSLSRQNMIMLSLLQTARVKQCFIIIVLPFVYDLDKNIILGMADLHINCYREPFGTRGQFRCYDQNALRRLWLHCRQEYAYVDKIAAPNFYGRFVKFFPFDEEQYLQKKSLALKQMAAADDKVGIRHKAHRDELIRMMKENNIPVKNIAERLKLSQKAIYNAINAAEVESG